MSSPWSKPEGSNSHPRDLLHEVASDCSDNSVPTSLLCEVDEDIADNTSTTSAEGEDSLRREREWKTYDLRDDTGAPPGERVRAPSASLSNGPQSRPSSIRTTNSSSSIVSSTLSRLSSYQISASTGISSFLSKIPIPSKDTLDTLIGICAGKSLETQAEYRDATQIFRGPPPPPHLLEVIEENPAWAGEVGGFVTGIRKPLPSYRHSADEPNSGIVFRYRIEGTAPKAHPCVKALRKSKERSRLQIPVLRPVGLGTIQLPANQDHSDGLSCHSQSRQITEEDLNRQSHLGSEDPHFPLDEDKADNLSFKGRMARRGTFLEYPPRSAYHRSSPKVDYNTGMVGIDKSEEPVDDRYGAGFSAIKQYALNWEELDPQPGGIYDWMNEITPSGEIPEPIQPYLIEPTIPTSCNLSALDPVRGHLTRYFSKEGGDSAIATGELDRLLAQIACRTRGPALAKTTRKQHILRPPKRRCQILMKERKARREATEGGDGNSEQENIQLLRQPTGILVQVGDKNSKGRQGKGAIFVAGSSRRVRFGDTRGRILSGSSIGTNPTDKTSSQNVTPFATKGEGTKKAPVLTNSLRAGYLAALQESGGVIESSSEEEMSVPTRKFRYSSKNTD